MSEEREPSTETPEAPETSLTRRAFVKGAIAVAGATGLNWVPQPWAQAAEGATRQAVKPTLYLIATAHNDTQWNWTVQNTIREYIPATMQPNWALFEKYPAYNFNYEGVIHYMFFKEYHPDQWPQLQEWVRKGRWKLSGSWINAVDVNVPSAESLFRQALYGQQFYRREFGQVSRDIYLPDCFGFPYSLPSIGRHSGLTAFSTQKLSWGGWIDAPFSVGRWEGPDGAELVSSLRPGAYTSRLHSNIATDPEYADDFSKAGDRQVDLRYFGTGDTGGTPDEASVEWAQKSVENTSGAVRVVSASADQLAKDLKPSEIAALPHYKGELVMKTHGVGCYTSIAPRKKWNRLNEQMVDAAERASLAAAWLGGPAYPHDALTTAWIRTLWHQFHDDLPGTCIPQAYTFSWNDDLLNLNQFSQIVTTGVGAIAQHLDTQTQGVALVVYNPLDQPRTEVVEATVALPRTSPAIRVYDTTTGKEVASQTLSHDGRQVKLLLAATVPAVGCRVFDVRPSPTPCALKTSLSITSTGLENSRYRVAVNAAGDISSVFDKRTKKELLSGPSTLEYFHDLSKDWPAWEIMWNTISKPPLGVVNENPRIRIVEQGPARVSLEVTRNLGDSTFVQHLRLSPQSEWVEIHNELDWKTPGTLVKAAFPMTATNPNATFDLGLGVVERPNAEPNRYEVNAQQWADITDTGGAHGLAVLTQFKYGWDKPSDNTLRLSLIRTPDGGGGWRHQDTNDIGKHYFAYALASHAGDWRKGNIPQQAARFNQPLHAFQTSSHAGTGGREFSLLRISTEQVAVRALKKAEDTDEVVIRLQELHGQPAKRVIVSFAAPVVGVREINAAEEVVGAYQAQGGKLVLDLNRYQPRTFAVKLAASPGKIAPVRSTPVRLAYDLNGISHHADLMSGAFQEDGQAYPAELWPTQVTSDGIAFTLGSSTPNAKNMVTCNGQTITLPAGSHNRLYLLAASIGGDQTGQFTLHTQAGQTPHALTVQDWAQHVGQWDSRLSHPSVGNGGGQIVSEVKDGKVIGLEKMRPAYVKRDPIAWVGSHRHGREGDQAYLFCYLFKYRLDLPAGTTRITLPQNPNIRVMAMTAAQNHLDDTRPAGVLYEPQLTDATIPKLPVAVRPTGPLKIVYRLDALQTLDGTNVGPTQVDVPDLPTEANAPWTINTWAYMDAQPDTRTLLVGFGDASDSGGQQRYIGRIVGGIHFWGSDVDIDTKQPYDVGKWQMLTSVFDGTTVTLYKNGEKLTSASVELNEAAPVVKIAPAGPWGDHRFKGKIQGVTIWNGALAAAAIHALMASSPAATP